MSKPKPTHVTFDEEVIKEHDKLRGTRQKIDEPDTPFHRGSFDEAMSEDGEENIGQGRLVNESMDVGTIELKAGNVPTTTPVAPRFKNESTGSQEFQKGGIDFGALESRLQEAAEANELPKAANKFEDKRKAHYNEFQRLKEWRERQKQGLDDEEDE